MISRLVGLALVAVSVGSMGAAGASTSDEAQRRTVWVDFESGARRIAIAIDSDAAWIDEAPEEARQVCVGEGPCAAVVATLRRGPFAVPLPGRVLVLQRRLMEVSPWPRDADQEAVLVAELRRDPRLRPLLRHYRPPSATPATFGLSSIAPGGGPTEPDYRWEGSLSAASLMRRKGDAAAVGAELSFGFTIGSDYDRPGESLFGDSFGVSARLGLYPWTTSSKAADDERLLTLSLSPELTNVVDPFTNSRYRGPSLLGVVTPEIGWIHQSGWDSAFVRWRVPFAVLLSYSWGLELRPSAGIVYDGPKGQADWIFGVALGSLLRCDGSRQRHVR